MILCILGVTENGNILLLISDTVVAIAISVTIGKMKIHMDKKRQEH